MKQLLMLSTLLLSGCTSYAPKYTMNQTVHINHGFYKDCDFKITNLTDLDWYYEYGGWISCEPGVSTYMLMREKDL